MIDACYRQEVAVDVKLLNYTKEKTPIAQRISITPCTCSSKTSMFLCISDISFNLCPSLTAAEMSFPMYVIPMVEFLKLDRMRPHGALVADGIAVVYEEKLHGKVNFVSHQWLSDSHPDPNNKQLRSIQSMYNMIIDGKDPFKRPEDWSLYATRFDYANVVEDDVGHDGERRKSHVETKEVATLGDFRGSINGGCVWLDFASIPQLVDIVDEREYTSFAVQQKLAIDSIPGERRVLGGH
jgi:hypothetical protein